MKNVIKQLRTIFGNKNEYLDIITKDTATLKKIKKNPEVLERIKQEFSMFTEENYRQSDHYKTTKPIILDLFEIMHKEKIIKVLPEEDIAVLANTMQICSFVSNRMLDDVEKDPEFILIHNHILSILNKESDITALDDIYAKQLNLSVDILTKRIASLEMKFYGEQYVNVQKLRKSRRTDKANIIENISKSSMEYGSVTHKAIKALHNDIQDLKSGRTFKLNAQMLDIKVDDTRYIERISYIIFRPHCLSFYFIVSDDRFTSLHIKGLIKHLPLPTVLDLMTLHDSGADIAHYFASKYKKSFETITNTIASPYMSPPLSTIICCRRDAINQILHSYREELFYPATCSLLAMIEGILWSFADFVHRFGEKIFEHSEDTGKIVAIINKTNGDKNDNLTVGTLLNISAINNILDKDFINYFCQEFYRDRNDFLHGDNWSDANVVKTAEKMAVLEYTLVESHEYIKKYWIDRYQSELPKEAIDMLYFKYMGKGHS
jgi:hypothetical protein